MLIFMGVSSAFIQLLSMTFLTSKTCREKSKNSTNICLVPHIHGEIKEVIPGGVNLSLSIFVAFKINRCYNLED